jgi:hypothetical protein
MSSSASLLSQALALEVDVVISSIWDAPGGPPKAGGFDLIRVEVYIRANSSTAALRAVIEHAGLWSLAANTIHDPASA